MEFPAQRYFGRFREAAPAQIVPHGHLREFLKRQREGLTGNFREMGYPFDSGLWNGRMAEVHFTEGVHNGGHTPAVAEGVWWPYEQTGYLLDGMLRLSLLCDAPELQQLYRENLEYLISHPDAKGMLGHGYSSADTEWPMAVFFKSVMAWVEATDDRRAIEAFHRHYAALPLETLAKPGRNATNIEGVLKLYEWTGDRSLLDKAVEAYALNDTLATRADDLYGELNLGKLASGERLVLHGVTFAEMLKIPAALYCYTGDERYLEAAQKGLDAARRDHLQPSGQLSANEFLSGRDPLQGFETCVCSDLLWSLGYFLRAAGTVRYADMMERLAFNVLPGAVTKDFTGLQYLSAVNQVNATPFSNNSHFNFGEAAWRQYRPSHFPECCPGNVHRAMPNYVLRMWMLAAADGAPAAMLYGPSRFEFQFQGRQVAIEERTEYPFSERIDFAFQLPGPALAMPFRFRVPEWTTGLTVLLNGQPLAVAAPKGSIAEIVRDWADGDVLTLVIAVATAMPADRHWTWFERGPLVFSYPVPCEDVRESDSRFSPRVLHPSGPWNYAPDLSPAEAARLVPQARPSSYPFATPSLVLEVPVRQISGYDALADGRFTPAPPLYFQPTSPRQTIALHPYGSTLTRITAFPRLCQRRPLPLVAVYVAGPYPYNWKLPLAGQDFAPAHWDDSQFRRQRVIVQRNADGFLDLAGHFGKSEGLFAYVMFRIWADQAGAGTVALGVASCAQVCHRGREIFAIAGLNEAEMMAPHWFPCEFEPGYNYLFAKIAARPRCSQYRREWGAKLEAFVESPLPRT